MYKHAFILAAGMGSRLRPYTDTMPKPMVSVIGKPIIDHILDKLVDAGITHVTVNLHYMGDILKEHLSDRADIHITLSEETGLLDTGGGVKNALSTLGDKPFFIINGDAFWSEGKTDIFSRLSSQWQDDDMDILLALQPIERMTLTKGVGDYHLSDQKHASRDTSQKGNMMFAGIRLCHPRIFEKTSDTAFSFLELMDKAESNNRLYGIEHLGDWHHISTPEELDRVNATLQGEATDE